MINRAISYQQSIKRYTDAKNLFLEAASLYVARELVKSRPVIK